MDENLKAIVIVACLFLAFLLVIATSSSYRQLRCIEILKDKSALEIQAVCK